MSHRTFDNPNSIEARQFLLDCRCEHAPKRHGTGKKKSYRNKYKSNKTILDKKYKEYKQNSKLISLFFLGIISHYPK